MRFLFALFIMSAGRPLFTTTYSLFTITYFVGASIARPLFTTTRRRRISLCGAKYHLRIAQISLRSNITVQHFFTFHYYLLLKIVVEVENLTSYLNELQIVLQFKS